MHMFIWAPPRSRPEYSLSFSPFPLFSQYQFPLFSFSPGSEWSAPASRRGHIFSRKNCMAATYPSVNHKIASCAITKAL